MFGLEPTPFDLRLVAFRIPIRVNPSFWIAGAVLSWDSDHMDHVFLWVMCLFVSILVHELGHALVAEAFGWASEIVLYMMGGLTMSQRYYNRTPWREIAVSLAGPFAGFGLYGLVLIAEGFWLNGRERDVHFNVLLVFRYLEFINLYWGLVNLLPVPPLDGGQICQSFLLWCRFRDPGRVASQIGVLVAGAAAFYFFNYWHSQFAGILFAMLCLQNVVSLQSPRH
ncbi:MAG: M50 family metallopeptidase [Planctomycetes bacterium]|nr:M50 family metallopeptidase [Planctomycetota bacterium]